ncbi:phosphomannomutase/phosphoglucomutase [Candidatus Parcubacteria bacterium]|nr:phosphomannomutase/phosphoglucomutase [Candidatus Parcubacteria bacterium]
MINENIFRLYDLRGIYPQEINEETTYQIGRCFILLLKKKNKKKKLKIAVGRDIRESSPRLFKGFADGVRDEGGDVVDLGLITTPMLYFAVSKYDYDGGVIITSSHNPNPFNGLKMTREKAIPVAGDSGIFWMRDYLLKHEFVKEKNNKIKRGRISKKNIEKEYIQSNLKLARIKKGELKGISLSIDAGNGVGGPIILKILKNTGIKVYPLYCNPDGSFPNHVPDPMIQDNLRDIIKLVKEKKSDMGVALDGDADRVIFINEKAEPIPGDFITALMAKIILEELPLSKRKKSKILYDIRSSNIIKESIKEGKGIQFCIGHSLIKEKMRKDNIIFGGEMSGHYYYGEKLFYEIPFIVLLKILKRIKKEREPLSKMISPFQKYYHSGEINFVTEKKEEKMKKLKKMYSKGKITEIDGLRIDFDDFWFLLRPSNTEPVLRLVIEAKNKDVFAKKKQELIKAINAPFK